MTAGDWARLKLWFGEALAAQPKERPRIVDRLRQESPSLALELESLITAHETHSLATVDLTVRSLPAPEVFPPGLPPASPIGPYRILRELGHGGDGRVFLAERGDDEFHRPVALKLLHFAVPDPQARSGLTHERGSLARMQHGNIAVLLDWGASAEGVPWLATEFVPGEPIDAYCRSRRLPEHAILQLFAQVTGAVAYAHRRGVVHRDLKPGNILVNQEGVVKLLDFGISQLAEAGPEHSVARRFTPVYATPEQLSGEPATPASDVYSLAVVLGQLLSGVLPPDLSRISPGLAPILRHALEANPARRYAAVESFQSDLIRYARHRAPLGIPTPWPRRAGLFCRRNRMAVALVGLAAAAGLGVGFWRTLPPRGWRRPEPAIAFSRVPVGHGGETLPLRVVWPRGARVQSVAVVTGGAPGLDFTSPDSAACVGAFTAGSSCVMHIRFSPTAADVRLGAVLFRDPDGHIVNTQYLSGTGLGGAGWAPAPRPERIVTGLNFARGLSTDGRGNAYFVEALGNTVDEIPAGGAPLRILARLPLSLQGGATAVDGAGNVYFSSSAGHAIYRLENGVPTPIAAVPSNTLLDDNLSVDGAGNLYASGMNGGMYMIASGSHKVVRLYPGGRGHRFVALTSDSVGNLFCPDYISNALYELPMGSTRLVQLVAPGHMDQPHAIVVLMGWDLLVGNDVPNGRVLRYSFPSFRATPLPILGNQSLALFGQSRLFTVVNNSQVFVYRLTPAPHI